MRTSGGSVGQNDHVWIGGPQQALGLRVYHQERDHTVFFPLGSQVIIIHRKKNRTASSMHAQKRFMHEVQATLMFLLIWTQYDSDVHANALGARLTQSIM
jgi:hypothetical protein